MVIMSSGRCLRAKYVHYRHSLDLQELLALPQHHLAESQRRRREGIDTGEVVRAKMVARVANVGTTGTEGVVVKIVTARHLRKQPLTHLLPTRRWPMAMVPRITPKRAGTGKDIEDEREEARMRKKKTGKGLKVQRLSPSRKRSGSADTGVVSAADVTKRPRMAPMTNDDARGGAD